MRHPAYHLRTNKAVDRLTLFDQIRVILGNPQQATFYSLSGPFLEDMKLAHHFFPLMKLVSVESNLHTYSRQKFHDFTSRLALEHKAFDRFIVHDYQAGTQDFFWLDFTDLSLRSINSFKETVVRVPHGSLVRITLNADPDWRLARLTSLLSAEQLAELSKQIDEEFQLKFGAVLSADSVRSPLCGSAEFARTVQLMIKRAAGSALNDAAERRFVHIGSARYDDGSQMLSVTGVVCDLDKIPDTSRLLEKNGMLAEVDAWSPPVEIEVPDLSIVERHLLDKILPRKDRESLGRTLQTKLKYNIDNSKPRSEAALRQYARYYREYPNFVKAAR